MSKQPLSKVLRNVLILIIVLILISLLYPLFIDINDITSPSRSYFTRFADTLLKLFVIVFFILLLGAIINSRKKRRH